MNAADPTMKIGYVLKRYPRFSETFVVNEIIALERAGVSVEIFPLGPVQESHFQADIARVRAPVRRVRDHFNNSMLLWQLLVESRRTLPGFRHHPEVADPHDADTVGQALVLARKARLHGIQHFHAHFGTQAATIARLAGAFAGIPYSFTAHAKDIYHQYEVPVGLDEKIRDAAFTVTVSDYNLNYLRKMHGATAHNSHRIYNGLDLDRFVYRPPATHSREIIAVGRLVEKKGFPTLIDAIAQLRNRGIDCHCTLVGDGPLRGQLAGQIEALGLNDWVTLAGPRPQDDVIALTRNARVMVAPSIISTGGDRDGLPTILVEAMALGTPCISTSVVGIPELVRHQESGLCVPPNNADALADAIIELLSDPAKCAHLAQNARERIERDFDIHRNTRLLQALFRQSIQNARPAEHSRTALPEEA